MNSEHLMFAGIFGIALAASACATPAAHDEPSQERLGKVSSAQTYYCSCAGMPGEWTASYSSSQEANSRVGFHCVNGGACSTESGSGSSSGSASVSHPS